MLAERVSVPVPDFTRELLPPMAPEKESLDETFSVRVDAPAEFVTTPLPKSPVMI